MWFVFLIVVSLWVIINVVWLIDSFVSDFWIVSFVFVFNVEVVLFNIKIGGFFKNICVIVRCCFCLFESFMLCLLIIVFRLFGCE